MEIALTFVLIHSPLVGPSTWSTVATELRAHGFEVILPVLHDSSSSATPYWRQHADAVADALASTSVTSRLVLVAHSGAGPLLPAIRQALPHPVAAYLFVDAGIPRDGESRLELLARESPELAERFGRDLAAGERFPTWSDQDLAPVIPDAVLRREVIQELRPRDLRFFTEPLPVFDGWPDAPVGYLGFSASYEAYVRQAREDGWHVQELPAGHFHMLVDARAVSEALLRLLQRMAVVARGEAPRAPGAER